MQAVSSIKEMNPNFNGEGFKEKLCSETETFFDEDFWKKQNFIIYAVDSV